MEAIPLVSQFRAVDDRNQEVLQHFDIPGRRWKQVDVCVGIKCTERTKDCHGDLHIQASWIEVFDVLLGSRKRGFLARCNFTWEIQPAVEPKIDAIGSRWLVRHGDRGLTK